MPNYQQYDNYERWLMSLLNKLHDAADSASLVDLRALSEQLAEMRTEMFSHKSARKHNEGVEKSYVDAAHAMLDKAKELIAKPESVEPRDIPALRGFVVNFGKIALIEKRNDYRIDIKSHHKIQAVLANAEPLFTKSIDEAIQSERHRISWSPKSMAALMGAFARLYYKPTLLTKPWCDLLTDKSYDLSDEMVISSILYSMGTLKIKPDAEILNKYIQALNSNKAPNTHTVANALHGLAMIAANEVDLYQSPLAEHVIGRLLKTSDTFFAKDSQKWDMEDVRSQITLYQCFIAQQMFRSHPRRNFEIHHRVVDSQLQNRFLEALQSALEKWKSEHPEEKIQINIKEEQHLSLTQTSVDFVIECFGSSKKTVSWIQVDGKMQHYLQDKDDQLELRGQDTLQQKVAEKHLEAGSTFRRVSYQEIYPSHVNDRPEEKEKIVEECISRIADSLIEQAVQSYKAQAELARIKPRSHRRS